MKNPSTKKNPFTSVGLSGVHAIARAQETEAPLAPGSS